MWRVAHAPPGRRHAHEVDARFVFVGAGGGALHLLQKSGIPEIKGFGGFPISGEFLRTDDPTIVAQHQAKVYGKAAVGSPPMSVPHLDTRVVDGQASLLFGPYAGFSPKFLKTGSWFDLFASIRPHNLVPDARAPGSTTSSSSSTWSASCWRRKRRSSRRCGVHARRATPRTGTCITAGQRVQVMKKDAKKGGVLQFGTEVIAAADGIDRRPARRLAGRLHGRADHARRARALLPRPDRRRGAPSSARMIPTYGDAARRRRGASRRRRSGATAEALRIQRAARCRSRRQRADEEARPVPA